MTLKMSKKQKHFYLNSDAKINVSHGAVRSGKTFITNLRWLKYIREGPEGKLLMSGRTKQTIKDNVLDDLFALVGKSNYKYNQSTGDLTIFNRQIKVVGADNALSEEKIRGQTYAGWYGDEITIQHQSFVKQAITRCSVAGAMIFWTTNPDHPKHNIKTNFIDNKEMNDKGQVKTWHFLLEDNKTLTDDYVDLLKASFSGVFYERNIEGKWVLAEGIVYGSDFTEQTHTKRDSEIERMLAEGAFSHFIAGVDFGYTHPMAGMLVGVTHDWEYYLIDEYYRTQQRTESLASWFTRYEEKLGKKIQILFCDSAEPDRIMTLKTHGLRATGSDKQISAGINTVQTCFKNMRLFIADRCVNTISELGLYRYPDKDESDKIVKDVPVDADNHALDALRYVIHNYEKIRLKEQSGKKKRTSRKRSSRR
jgi:PBSX family phage terminase large subunit